MRTAVVIPFLWLGLVHQPDSAAAGNVSTDSNAQCLVGTIVNQALKLQQLSSQVLQQGSQLQEQASQLQQQSSQLQQQSSQLQQLRNLQKKVTSMDSELEWHSATLLALNNSGSRQAGFSVRYTGISTINVGTGGTLKYNNVITNIGGGYSPLTGHFTAPHSGIYAFFTSLRSTNDHPWILLAIFKAGQSLVGVTADGEDDRWDRGTALVTTHMNKGEIAYVRQTASSTFLEAGPFTTFSGMLVAAD